MNCLVFRLVGGTECLQLSIQSRELNRLGIDSVDSGAFMGHWQGGHACARGAGSEYGAKSPFTAAQVECVSVMAVDLGTQSRCR